MPFLRNMANAASAPGGLLVSVVSALMAAAIMRNTNPPNVTVEAPAPAPFLDEEDLRAWRILMQTFSRICEMKFILSVLQFVNDHAIWSFIIGLSTLLATCAIIHYLYVVPFVIWKMRKDMGELIQTGFNLNLSAIANVSHSLAPLNEIVGGLDERLDFLGNTLHDRIRKLHTSIHQKVDALNDGLQQHTTTLNTLQQTIAGMTHELSNLSTITEVFRREVQTQTKKVEEVISPACEMIGHAIYTFHDPLADLIGRSYDIQEECVRVLRPLAANPFLGKDPRAGGEEHPQMQRVGDFDAQEAMSRMWDGSIADGQDEGVDWARRWAFAVPNRYTSESSTAGQVAAEDGTEESPRGNAQWWG
ncbi:MAG: hypothetical protein M1831_000026 [Alyxoria varia]|nr:MAG: hypothetical protein M1831_000026 [Alyxoria varia]